jgi:RNA polymerase sigma-70 factor, ECF subfamily
MPYGSRNVTPMHVARNRDRDGGPSSQSTAPISRLSELALLNRARARDVDAFEELVGRTETQLYRLAMRYLHDESDSQEVLQDSYLSAWKCLPRFEGRSQFGSWMHRIVVNTSLMRLRIRHRHPEVAIRDVDLGELDEALGTARYASIARSSRPDRPDQKMQSAELLRHLERAVNCLPEKLKEIFLLRDVSEVSTTEAAVKLGVSAPAAKTRLHRARKVLRESLGEYLAS